MNNPGKYADIKIQDRQKAPSQIEAAGSAKVALADLIFAGSYIDLITCVINDAKQVSGVIKIAEQKGQDIRQFPKTGLCY
jgi:hypothetical protein